MDIQKVVFMLMAQDVDRAIAFYTNVIGLDVRYRSPDWTEPACGDAVVALHGGGNGEFKSTGLGFTVADVDSACKEATAGGGKVITGPFNLHSGVVVNERDDISVSEGYENCRADKFDAESRLVTSWGAPGMAKSGAEVQRV